MPLETYVERKFSAESLSLINICNTIITTYRASGYRLTLRQLYYRCVAAGHIPNNVKSYKRLGSIINDARLAGLVDWEAIEDRMRSLHQLAAWEDPAEVVAACARQFRIDKWEKQPCRVEIWVEKDALSEVFERVGDRLQVPVFCCRGYTSQSAMWEAGKRLLQHVESDQKVKLIHFGDHDPSGLDMTRDIVDRLTMFTGDDVDLKRLALNMGQVEEYDPPENPAKTTDSRSAKYIDLYGTSSWELDALEPDVLAQLVEDFVLGVRDEALWAEALQEEAEHKRLLGEVSDRWTELTDDL